MKPRDQCCHFSMRDEKTSGNLAMESNYSKTKGQSKKFVSPSSSRKDWPRID